MNKLKQFLARQQEGIFWGGLVGLCAFILKDRFEILQKLILGNNWLNNVAAFIFVGMSVGALIDSIYKPNK